MWLPIQKQQLKLTSTLPHLPLCFTVISTPFAQLNALSLHSLSYVKPLLPHTGSTVFGHFSMLGQSHSVEPLEWSLHTAWFKQRAAWQGSNVITRNKKISSFESFCQTLQHNSYNRRYCAFGENPLLMTERFPMVHWSTFLRTKSKANLYKSVFNEGEHWLLVTQ